MIEVLKIEKKPINTMTLKRALEIALEKAALDLAKAYGAIHENNDPRLTDILHTIADTKKADYDGIIELYEACKEM